MSSRAEAATPDHSVDVCSSPDRAAPKRELWTPGESRFLRHWLLLGPISGSLTPEPVIAAAATPSPGLKQALSDGRTLIWEPQSSWTDIVDVADLLATPAYRGSQAAPEVAYAYGAVDCDRATDVVLSVASDGPLHVWLNGSRVEAINEQRTFLFDQDRVTMHLQKGRNGVLVELEHRSGAWRFAMRMREPGQLAVPLEEITPVLTGGPGGSLNILTDVTPNNAGAPVHVAAVAPGGDVLAQTDSPRGTTARFAAESWPEGPYEIRLTTSTAWGKREVVHLAWYKGDARIAAQRLLDAAQRAPAGASGASLRTLADLVRDRLGERPLAAPDDSWPRIHSALMEYAEQQQQAAGRAGSVRPYGFVRLAYTDDVDGSTQFCRAYLPPDYAPARRWPLIIMMHGFNPPNPPYVRWWDAAKRHDATADRHDVIVLEPLGRGNAQYLGIGELDVLRCLAQAKERFSVDDDRVYLTGESMGGSGTWLIASHHPDLFAAAAPVFGGWDYRILPGSGFDNLPADQGPERFAAEVQSSFAAAESLLDLPLLVTHGDSDQSVPVEFSRHAVTMLQRWNYDIRYQEIPHRGHEDLDLRDRIVSWLLDHRRLRAPHAVRIRSSELNSASAYWARVEAFEEPLRMIEVDAQVLRPGVVRLDTRNVAALRLDLPEELRGSSGLRVTWNGRNIAAMHDARGAILLQAPDEKLSPGDKRPGLEGGLSNLITTPFAIVEGTASRDPRMRELCHRKARAFAERWAAWQHVMPRVFRDDELTAADERRYSLLLIGGPDANRVTRRLASRLPLHIDGRSVTIDGKRFEAVDAVVEMIYPSPAQPARYVTVVAATSTEGMYFWDPTSLWQMPLGYPTQPLDWTIRDGRLVALGFGLGSGRSAVASGVFDRHWRLADDGIFRGDAALRAASPLRHPPHDPHALAPSSMVSYVGRYEAFKVSASGQGLALDTGDGLRYALAEESDNVFAVGDTGAVAIFSRDARGDISGLTLNESGQQWAAKRLD
jgi:poly(3-hydroxybutyrate) depolymerase